MSRFPLLWHQFCNLISPFLLYTLHTRTYTFNNSDRIINILNIIFEALEFTIFFTFHSRASILTLLLAILKFWNFSFLSTYYMLLYWTFHIQELIYTNNSFKIITISSEALNTSFSSTLYTTLNNSLTYSSLIHLQSTPCVGARNYNKGSTSYVIIHIFY